MISNSGNGVRNFDTCESYTVIKSIVLYFSNDIGNYKVGYFCSI